MSDNPVASVCCVTYNHERFIRAALDGFLMQKTNFAFEVIVHDDASTDGTAGIIREYERLFPNVIRPIYQTENQYSKGTKVSATYVWPKARGRYIALCEGDDYWTDPLKLQKQVDFLDQNREFSMCFHDVNVRYEDGVVPDIVFTLDDRDTYSVEDLLRRNFIPTCSVVFRRGLAEALPGWFFELRVGDWPLHILNAATGRIGRLRSVMGVYRVHAGGQWSTLDYADRVADALCLYDAVNAHFGFRFDRTIRAAKTRACGGLRQHVALQAIAARNVHDATSFVRRALHDLSPRLHLSVLWKLRLICKIYAYFLYAHWRGKPPIARSASELN